MQVVRAKMEERALMESTVTHVPVLLAILEHSVKQVSSTTPFAQFTTCKITFKNKAGQAKCAFCG